MKIVLAYSGSDTSVLVSWLKKQYSEDYYLAADVGQEEELDGTKGESYGCL